jgi:DNA-binding transcriptional MerR regulator
MAGKPKPMSQIKQLILMQQQGFSIKKIARALQMSKNTVKQYLAKLQILDKPPQSLLRQDDPELERLLHAGNPAYSDQRFGQLKGKLDYYLKELRRDSVTRKLLWEEYRQVYPDGYQYAQFCFHLSQHQRNAKPFLCLNTNRQTSCSLILPVALPIMWIPTVARYMCASFVWPVCRARTTVLS